MPPLQCARLASPMRQATWVHEGADAAQLSARLPPQLPPAPPLLPPSLRRLDDDAPKLPESPPSTAAAAAAAHVVTAPAAAAAHAVAASAAAGAGRSAPSKPRLTLPPRRRRGVHAARLPPARQRACPSGLRVSHAAQTAAQHANGRNTYVPCAQHRQLWLSRGHMCTAVVTSGPASGALLPEQALKQRRAALTGAKPLLLRQPLL